MKLFLDTEQRDTPSERERNIVVGIGLHIEIRCYMACARILAAPHLCPRLGIERADYLHGVFEFLARQPHGRSDTVEMHFREKVEVVLHYSYGMVKLRAAVVASAQLNQHGIPQVYGPHTRRIKQLHFFSTLFT